MLTRALIKKSSYFNINFHPYYQNFCFEYFVMYKCEFYKNMNSVKRDNFDLITFHGLNEIFYFTWSEFGVDQTIGYKRFHQGHER